MVNQPWFNWIEPTRLIVVENSNKRWPTTNLCATTTLNKEIFLFKFKLNKHFHDGSFFVPKKSIWRTWWWLSDFPDSVCSNIQWISDFYIWSAPFKKKIHDSFKFFLEKAARRIPDKKSAWNNLKSYEEFLD